MHDKNKYRHRQTDQFHGNTKLLYINRSVFKRENPDSLQQFTVFTIYDDVIIIRFQFYAVYCAQVNR